MTVHKGGRKRPETRDRITLTKALDNGRQDLTSSALKPSPMRGRGTAAAVDEVPTQAPDFVVSLSCVLDNDLTSKLIIMLRPAGLMLRKRRIQYQTLVSF